MRSRHTQLRPTILALGSHQGDDQAAWYVIDRLQEVGGYPGKCVRVVSPWDIVPYLEDAAEILILDACRTGAVAGTVHHIAARDLPKFEGIETSTHGGSLQEALEMCRILGYDVSRVTVYAVELETVEYGAAMSPAVQQGAGRLAQEIRNTWSGDAPKID